MSKSSVPLLDLKKQYSSFKPQLLGKLEQLLENGSFVLGEEVKLFEKEIADFLDSHFALGVTSGTDALWLSLKALGVGPGDKVLTSPFTFFATVSAIVNTGAKPVFADIQEDTFNLDPQSVAQVLAQDREKNIKAMIPIHLYGHSAQMDELQKIAAKHEVAVVEDAAQSIGTEFRGKKVGTFGAFGSFSFYPTKNLGALGDAGLIVTQDLRLFELIDQLRTHGGFKRYQHTVIGSNCRIDALQAGFLRIFLPHLKSWIVKRQEIASVYNRQIIRRNDEIIPPVVRDYSNHTYHQYTVRVRKGRDHLQEFLKENGIASCTYYPIPCHLQAALKSYGFKTGMFPVAEKTCLEALSLPIFPTMSEEEIERVVEVLLKWRPLV